jgi:2-octaprenyl-6-methoxyphenol hydroxylase|tara:strand:- start:4077 stop:5207 length:1131 start_codon:yes stop_codon:yes gene_type:complete
MKKHKICIVGGGLTGLISALVLAKKGLDIDLMVENLSPKNKDLRVTAISEKNMEFLKSTIKNINLKLFYPVKKINLFFEKNNQTKNFLNFNENKNLMFFFENRLTKKHLTKLLKKTNVKIQKKTIKSIDLAENKVSTKLSSKSYDLVVLCLGSNSPIYQKISGKREIKKNYKEHSITCSVKHQIKNIGAQQFFLKEGPLAILPYNNNKFSVVWSIEDKYFMKNQKNISNYLKIKLSNLLKTKKISLGNIQSYPLKLLLKRSYYKKNTIILGDGLHVVHPLAGQGFNLILRDLEKLNNLISNNLRLGLTIKDSNIPKDLSDSRKPENLLMGLGIDTTREFFKSNKYLDPIKENMLNNFSKSKLLKEITKRIANLGLN